MKIPELIECEKSKFLRENRKILSARKISKPEKNNRSGKDNNLFGLS